MEHENKSRRNSRNGRNLRNYASQRIFIFQNLDTIDYTMDAVLKDIVSIEIDQNTHLKTQ